MNEQREDTDSDFEFAPNMPDVMARETAAAYQIGPFSVLLSKDVPAIAERLARVSNIKIPAIMMMHFKYVLTVASAEGFSPKLFVTLERFGEGPYMLGVLQSGGSHSNYGTLDDPNDLGEFLQRGFELIKEHMHIHAVPLPVGSPELAQSKAKKPGEAKRTPSNWLLVPVGLLAVVSAPVLWTSAFALHVFTVIVAAGFVSPGTGRVIVAILAFSFPALSELVVLVVSFFVTDSLFNDYSKWLFGWLLLLAAIVLPPVILSKWADRK